MSPRLESLVEYAKSATQRAAASQDPARLAQLARKLESLADQEIIKIHSEGTVPACRKGCDACCHRLVAATYAEILAIFQQVSATFSAEAQAALRSRTGELNEANSDFWKYRSPLANGTCPFLVDHECSVYELRPLSCRTRNSLDAAVCHQTYIEGQAVPQLSIPAQIDVQQLNLSTIGVSRDAGIPSGLYELGPAVAAALDDPSVLSDNPVLERLKIYSERNYLKASVSAPLRKHLEDPTKAEAANLIHAADVDAMNAILDRYRGSPFELLFRLALPLQYRTTDEVDEQWQKWGEALERFEDANLPAQDIFELLQVYSTFSLAYTGRDVKPYLERFMAVVHKLASVAMPELTAPFEKPRKPGKVRLGFLSDRLTKFNGSRFALGWINHLSPEIEVYVLNLVSLEDDVSVCFRRAADRYFHLPFPVSSVAPFIRSLDLDGLIFTDVGMSGRTIQAASLRLARNQFNTWGHPVTSGSPTMDYFLSSELMEPENGQSHYSEKLVRLPGSGLTYPRILPNPSTNSASKLGVPEDGFLFIAQLPHKLVPADDWLFEEIAARSKKPLVLLESPKKACQAALRARFGKPGQNTMVLPFQERKDFLRLLQLADASLDPPSWSGGHTAIEALALRTPIVSLPGEFMRGRHGKGFLTQAGVPDLVAKDSQDFIELALDSARRQAAMENLDVDAIYEDPAPAKAISDLLLGLVD